MTRSRFDGEIFGMGTASGVRIVVGHWLASPLGEFTDVMVEFADGERLLIAPSDEVRDYVTATYTFDRTVVTPVKFSVEGSTRVVSAGDLLVRLELGRATLLGRMLSMVPRAVSTAPWFCALSDPIARVVMRGVRTRGTAGNGRREFYGARGQYAIESVVASWRGADLGTLGPVDPPVRFGFGSAPKRPSGTMLTTTIVDGG
ncbi:hypothetical protein [Antrihabitans cavernicola]|uniref:Uncharacterized protein n=1 Tax=Antrihabitans cavernicola TaxID=2495913 RepID=A0A5A7SG27_9NOCA|nr:hypothetical protein [Spelaeibacter cavernicola]KAA0023445.1 hypothetical protein FOY51_08550 [Spelaeibacter cavernicola]